MINGDKILKQKYPEYNKKNYTPNGLDLELGKVYELKNKTNNTPLPFQYGLFKTPLPEYELKEKELPEQIEIHPQQITPKLKGWTLLPNKVYILQTNKQITITNDCAQLYKPRSTLIRAGLYIYTSVGDSGYNGRLSFMCINHNTEPFFLEKDVRFAQLIDIEVKDNSITYNGDYQETKETPTNEEDWVKNRIQF